MKPAYLKLAESGELERRVAGAKRRLEDCDLCARYCRMNRRETLSGAVCRTGERAVVHGYGPHHGEEHPLRGRRGSGTIFFSWCNLRCVFCQNHDISWQGSGRVRRIAVDGAPAHAAVLKHDSGDHEVLVQLG
mgnify:CR=1 FL=1